MNIPAFTLNNSPIYLTIVLVLLLVALILINPIKKLIKEIKRKNKKKQAKKAKTLAKAPKEKVKTKTIKKKVFVQDWRTALFSILGIGLIISAILKSPNIFTNEFTGLYEFIFSYINHNNATTILVTIIFSSLLILVSSIIGELADKKNSALRTLYVILASTLIGGSLFIALKAAAQIGMSQINIILMGALFLIIGLVSNRKRIYTKIKVEENSESSY